eukprot:TRINITY_DN196_c0_g2_i4.p1 TRINITY_DN196_c0_g2~~TRINITY_DN196_c0_g2_i4.p1  ORF type:complete len:301 (-),score=29.52 TRINITY_DN196_c0_g2_i4:2-790(-)
MSVVGYWFQGVHAHRVRRQLFEKHFEEQMDRLDELRRSEEKARVATALQDSAQQADGILNHILKNTMADAAGCVHLFLSSAVPDRLDLHKALECLARGMQWCHNRLALIHIAAAQYAPDLVVVELKHLVGEVVAGRPVQFRCLCEQRPAGPPPGPDRFGERCRQRLPTRALRGPPRHAHGPLAPVAPRRQRPSRPPGARRSKSATPRILTVRSSRRILSTPCSRTAFDRCTPSSKTLRRLPPCPLRIMWGSQRSLRRRGPTA